jgi:hypothetical protein
MPRFIAFLIWAAPLSLLFWGMTNILADRAMKQLPESAPLLDEVKHYGWMIGIALAVVTAAVLV